MELCRLCIEKAESLLDIFGKFGKEQKICELIDLHLRFQISEEDPLSDKLCTRCWSKLIDFHTFYTQVQTAQERVAIKNEIEIVDDQRTDIFFANNFSKTDYNTDVKTENYQNDVKCEEFIAVDPLAVTDSNAIVSTYLGSHDVKHSLEITTKIDDNQLMCPRNPSRKENASNQLKQAEIDSVDDSRRKTERKYETRRQKRKMSSKDDTQKASAISENRNTQSQQEDIDDDNDSQRNSKRKCVTEQLRRKTSNVNQTQTARGRGRPRKDACEIKTKTTEEKKEQINIIESYFTMRCDLCQEDFDGFELLFEHYKKVHQIRGYIICCGKKFYKRRAIAEHVSWHKNPEDFACSACNINFLNKRSYDNHMLILHAPPDAELFQCEQCPKTFTEKTKLEKHNLIHLRDNEKSYICDECGKPYASEYMLRAHKRTIHLHTYSKMCEICAKVFKTRTFFEKHQLEHLGKNLPKVQCEKCGDWLKNEHTMRAHMRKHLDEGQDHVCDICGKRGPTRKSISSHKSNVHFIERKFQCTYCDKAFKRAISLKEHITIHTGEVLYKCTFCSKTSNSISNMHAHRKKDHPVEWLAEKQMKLEAMKPKEQKS